MDQDDDDAYFRRVTDRPGFRVIAEYICRNAVSAVRTHLPVSQIDFAINESAFG